MARQVSRSSRNGYYSEGSQADYASSAAGGYPSGSRQPAERVQQGAYASQPDAYQQQDGYGYQRQSSYQSQDAYQQDPYQQGYQQGGYAQSAYQQGGYYQQDPYESPRQRRASASGTRPVGYASGRGGRGGRGSGTGPSSRSGGAGRRSGGSARTKLVGVLAILVGLLIGFLVTFLVMNGRTGAPAPVSSTLTESQLDTVVGTYRYDGETYSITAREAILGSVSLDSVSNGDGTYEAPTADMILAYARNQILAQLVADNGITVTSDEVAAYAEETVGTSDMAAVAAYFDMDEDQAEEIMAEAAAVAKLRASVTGVSSTSAPEPPTPPADGDTEVGTAEYADYIIALLGSNWDSELGTWANTDNAYYTALQNMVFAPGSASYEAAEAAYAVAYQEWQASSGDAGDAWYAYVNQYLDEASIAIATLRA